MLRPGDSNYYKYAIGGKTGFTSDALSTLITMAEKDGVQLVCVVLRTHGKNVYPDTTKLLKYGFKKFSKIDISGLVQSDDVEEVLPGDNYVVVPKGITFADLDMELIPDTEYEDMATLTYTYSGNYVGCAKVKLSEAYRNARAAETEDSEEKTEKEGKNKKGKKKIKEKTGVFKIPGVSFLWERAKMSEKSKQDKMILAGACTLLAVLIIAFLAMIIRYRRRVRQKEENEDQEEEKKTGERARFEGYF